MEGLTKYNIPIATLKPGIFNYEFSIDDRFFKNFEASIIQKGKIKVNLELEKKTSLLELFFEIKGSITTICDRCLEPMQLSIDKEHRLLVKYSETLEDDLEVSYIPVATQVLNVGTYIYEFVHLAIPMMKTHEDANEDCPVELEDFLEEDAPDNEDTSVWDALKDIKTDSD